MSATDNTEYMLNSTMSLGEHLEDLRKRLINAVVGLAIGTAIGLYFGREIIAFMEIPYVHVMGPAARLQSLAPADGFISFMKIGFISGFIFASPWVFYQIWMFIAAGLYPHEKKYVYAAVPFSAILFVTGALFFMFLVAPLTLQFFVRFNRDFMGVTSQFTFQYYISFITQLMLIFGLAFQTPTAIFFLNRTGLISLKTLTNSRKYAILAITIIAAVATPGPDVVSQITLGIPLYLLFEIGIFLSWLAERKKSRKKTA